MNFPPSPPYSREEASCQAARQFSVRCDFCCLPQNSVTEIMNCSNTSKTREFPKEFACPITLQILEDCVIAEDGHTYEREAITRWFNAGQTRSPVTNEVLSNKALFPNLVLRRLISQYRTQLGEQLLVVCGNTEQDEDLIDLLDRGADVNIRHRETGKTPLLLLIEAKKFTLAQRLIDVYDADASIADNALQTCAQCAKRVDSTNLAFIHAVNKATSLAVAKHAMETHLKARERHLFRQRQEERGNPTTTAPAPIAMTREPSIGFFPSLFSLQFQSLVPFDVAPHAVGGGQGLFRRISTWSRTNLAQDREAAERGEIEYHHQHILSKSLLFMGSLVLLSLLLF